MEKALIPNRKNSTRSSQAENKAVCQDWAKRSCAVPQRLPRCFSFANERQRTVAAKRAAPQESFLLEVELLANNGNGCVLAGTPAPSDRAVMEGHPVDGTQASQPS